MRLIAKNSITLRLTLLFVLASSAVLLALGFVIASSVEKHFVEQDMAVLTAKMELAREQLTQLKSEGDLAHLAHLMEHSLQEHHGLELLLLGSQHEVLFATPKADFPFDFVASGVAQGPLHPDVWPHAGQTYRAIAAGLPTQLSQHPRVMVAVAINIAHHQAFMRSFLQTLWAFVAGAAVLTGVLGWAVARRGLAPLRAMREQTQSVTAQQLSHRLPVASVPVELAALAQSLNDMLARLEEAFLRLSDFSSDIAHELRTPVSNLMTQTQVALSRARSADDYRAILESNAEEYEHMARMISDMLLLAKAENGLALAHKEPVPLAHEVRALFDYYEALADEKGVQLVLQGDVQVNADRLMLRRALGNLLSNAVRHARAGTPVYVRLQEQVQGVCLVVENTGDTIKPEHLERIFDRFFRVDAARQRSGEGTGLGLAITRSIVLAHGGTIAAQSLGGMTTLTVTLPHGA